jgi:prepilin-type N-terminal cleavage/methylation domain-containing protein
MTRIVSNSRHSPDNGFTLIEMSIVLVIIGLVVGGIFVGQDLIRASQIRSQVAQLSELHTAVRTFTGKYGGIPGDLRAIDAARFGFKARSGGDYHGDGNFILDACAPSLSDTVLGCETSLFWSDLASAGFIAGSYAGAADSTITNVSITQVGMYFPEAKIGSRISLAAFSQLQDPYASTSYSSFYYSLAAITSVNSAGVLQVKNGITPIQASTLDIKIDDGDPYGGRIFGGGAYAYSVALGILSPYPCVALSGTYNTASSNASKLVCILNIVPQQ